MTVFANVNPDGPELSAQKVITIGNRDKDKVAYFVLVCPEGYFGDHCMTPCECKNDNFMCHPAQGCICRHGYAGKDCDESIVLSRVRQPSSDDNSNYGSVIAGVIVAIVAIVAAGCIFVYYRRRVSNLKTEIAHVQYIADPNAFSPGWITIHSIVFDIL
jgi:hypothetical protein